MYGVHAVNRLYDIVRCSVWLVLSGCRSCKTSSKWMIVVLYSMDASLESCTSGLKIT